MMVQPTSDKLGQKIRDARLGQGLTQDQLAAGQFSKTYISAVELGRIHPSVRALTYIANRLDLPLAYLLDEDDAANVQERDLVLLEDVRYQLLSHDYPAAKRSFERINANTLYGEKQEELQILGAELALAGNDPEAAERVLIGVMTKQGRQMGTLSAARIDYLTATCYLMRGQWQAAAKAARQALVTLQGLEAGDLHWELAITVKLQEALVVNDRREALALEPVLVRLSQQLGDTSTLAAAHYAKAVIERLAGSATKAQRHIEYALALAELQASLRIAQDTASSYATLYIAEGNREAARRSLDEALDYARRSRIPGRMAEAGGQLASFHLGCGELTAAGEALTEASAALAEEPINERVSGLLLLLRARLELARHESETASVLFLQAIARLEAAGAREPLGEACFRYAIALKDGGRVVESIAYLERAFTLTGPPR